MKHNDQNFLKQSPPITTVNTTIQCDEMLLNSSDHTMLTSNFHYQYYSFSLEEPLLLFIPHFSTDKNI